MSQVPVVRLHLFFALDNDRALILRQGASKRFNMILWHRNTDQFEDGQWLHHAVTPHLCDLSPDGRHFLFHALDGRWHREAKGSYSAISRPPYFTALALFPIGDSWSGGGRFLNNGLYTATGGADIIGRAEGLTRLFRHEPDKECPTGLRDVGGRCARVGRAASEILKAELPPSRTHALDRYDTQGGVLYRRRGSELEPIRDFTDMSFTQMRAPYDWRSEDEARPQPEGWHPLQGEGS